jgi:hypothetical protein
MTDVAALDVALAQVRAHVDAQRIAQISLPDNGTVDLTQAWNQRTWREVEIVGDDEEPLTPRCGTQMCLAGWVAELDEQVEWKIDPASYYRATIVTRKLHTSMIAAEHLRSQLPPGEARVQADILATRTRETWQRAFDLACEMRSNLDVVIVPPPADRDDGIPREEQVEMWAIDRLDLSVSQANGLFHGDNDLDQLEAKIERLRLDEEDPLDDDDDDDDEDDIDEDDDEGDADDD